mmetsp:Transcript_13700/g.33740  ORF Transcript_13700/g.33740 Transcript_13700/m.33740 type:complete len:271 (-) Transcript_13700:394-1206(-)
MPCAGLGFLPATSRVVPFSCGFAAVFCALFCDPLTGLCCGDSSSGSIFLVPALDVPPRVITGDQLVFSLYKLRGEITACGLGSLFPGENAKSSVRFCHFSRAAALAAEAAADDVAAPPRPPVALLRTTTLLKLADEAAGGASESFSGTTRTPIREGLTAISCSIQLVAARSSGFRRTWAGCSVPRPPKSFSSWAGDCDGAFGTRFFAPLSSSELCASSRKACSPPKAKRPPSSSAAPRSFRPSSSESSLYSSSPSSTYPGDASGVDGSCL